MKVSDVKLLNESVISLDEAHDLLPFRVGASTVRHWARIGFRGVMLETARIGWRRVTSKEALERFLNRVNSLEQNVRTESVPELAAAVAVA